MHDVITAMLEWLESPMQLIGQGQNFLLKPKTLKILFTAFQLVA